MRVKIARDLHDGPVEELVGDLFVLQGVAADIQDPDIRQAVQSVQENLQDQVGSLRVFAGGAPPTRPGQIWFGESHPLPPGKPPGKTPRHLDAVGGLPSRRAPSCPRRSELPLCRISQEAMNNIIRHAQATQVVVRFHKDDQSARRGGPGATGSVSAPPAVWVDLARQGHLGSVGVQERAEAIGGKLEVSSEAGEGTCLRVSILWRSIPHPPRQRRLHSGLIEHRVSRTKRQQQLAGSRPGPRRAGAGSRAVKAVCPVSS